MKQRVLVVDDTHNVQQMLSDFLTGQEFEVCNAYDGREALELVRAQKPELVLLDIMMPNMDGFQFLTQLRRESDVPVIMITARQAETDIIRGFDSGADDYITKPFRLRELLVRMRAVMRRSRLRSSAEEESLVSGELRLDRSRHELYQAGELVRLTPLEFKLMEALMSSAGSVLRKEDLAILLMDNGFSGSETTLKIHVRNIRIKLNDNATPPRYIETVFGVGYRLIEA